MTPDERASLHHAIKTAPDDALEGLARSVVARCEAAELAPSALLAAQEGRTAAAVALLAGRAPDAEDEKGNSVVSVASACGHVAILEALKATQPWSTDVSRKALRLAVQNAHRTAFDWLLAQGVDVNGAGNESSTLKAAAGRNRADWVDLLAAKGADVARFGPAALQFALERRQEDGARALVGQLTLPLDGRTHRRLVETARKWGNNPVLAAVKRLAVIEQGARSRPGAPGTLLDTVTCSQCGDVTLEIREVDGLERLLCQCTVCGFETWREN